MPTSAETWDCPERLNDELVRLLLLLDQQGPLSRDQLHRHCLHRRELLPRLNNRQRLIGQFDSRDAMLEALEHGEDATWRVWDAMLERTRWELNWLFFSHRQRRLVERRARYLTRQAQQRQWAQYCEADEWWIITSAGREALQLQRSSL